MGSSHWKEFLDYMKQRGSIESIMAVSADDGAMFATSDEKFYLREYKAKIMQEDGEEKEETVNEATNLVKFIRGQPVSQGLRINGLKKQQITRNFKDEETGNVVIFAKFPLGGSCIAHGGKCILIATYEEAKNHNSVECNETITQIARYLAKSAWPAPGSGPAVAFESSSDSTPITWQAYIDKLLVERGHVAQAMLVTADSANILAASPDFLLKVYSAEIPQEDGTDKTETVDEAKNIVKFMAKTKPPQGLRVNQIKYQVVRSVEDENSKCYAVFGKKSMGGCAVFQCGKCIIITTYDETKGHTSASSSTITSDLAKHLKNTLK